MSEKWSLALRRVPSPMVKDKAVIWNNVSLCYEQKLFGQVTSLSYNAARNMLGCTSTNQLALLRVPQSAGVVVNEQKERRVFALRFRADGKMYAHTSDQQVVVKSSETSFERHFLGHTREVRSVAFLGTHTFVSGSEDTTVKLWDILHEDALATGSAHNDYVRCLENGDAEALFFSGSYDHVVHLWDTRVGLQKPVQSSESSITSAVEALCYVAEGQLLACGAGDQLLLYDTRKGIQTPLTTASFHTKTVTAVSYAPRYKTLVTGSLDGRVKMLVLDGEELQCHASKRFSDAVSCVAVHPRCEEFCVGLVSGSVQVYRLPASPSVDAPAERARVQHKMTGTSAGVLQAKVRGVEFQLGSFQYGKALKTALYSRQPDIVVSTLEELLRRGALHIVLNNQNDRTVARVLRFATAFLDKAQFTDTMTAVIEEVFMIYGVAVSRSVFLHRELLLARKRVAASLATLCRMKATLSVMEMIVDE